MVRAKGDGKYYREIGAEMIGNHLIIRMEKDKNKKRRLDDWDPPCDCEVIEIKRPSGKEGPKIVNAGDNNQILFQNPSQSNLGFKDEMSYKPTHAIAYKVAPSKGAASSDCKVIKVQPQIGAREGEQRVETEHVIEGQQEIFLLKIKKNHESQDQPKQSLEVELRTPKPPTPVPGKIEESDSPVAPGGDVAVAKVEVEKKAKTGKGKKGKTKKGKKK